MNTSDEILSERIWAELKDLPGMVSKKMFGGVGFLVRGNMACGVHKGGLIVRVGPEKYEALLAQPLTRPFDMTGRQMAGWIVVDPPGFDRQEDLHNWVWQGVEYARTLPVK